MKIKKVEIEGFRAYKSKRDGTFDFTINGNQPSNFIAIYGPNGFGKSSFFDAVEWAFTANLKRYIINNNRKNNELAAVGTKKDGIAQHILRNKYISKDVITSVSIDTTHQSYTRILEETKPNSRDFKFHKKETEKGTEFFKEIILSQAAIDQFLGEVKPQERYNLFMEHFGGDLERLRQEITILLSDNNNILSSLEGQKYSLKAQLKVPINESVFSAFNYTAKELNQEGESIDVITTSFTESKEHEIISYIVTRIHKLKSTLNEYQVTQGELRKRLVEVPHIQNVLNSVATEKLYLDKLSKGIKDAQQYQDFSDLYSKLTEDIKLTEKNIKELYSVKNYIPDYTQAIQEIKNENEYQVVIHEEKLEKDLIIRKAESLVKEINEELIVINKSNSDLKSLISESGHIYSDISNNKDQLLSFETELLAKNNMLNSYLFDYNKTDSAIVELSSITVDFNTLTTKNINLLRLDSQILNEIRDVNHKFNILGIEEQKSRRAQKALNKQTEVIEQLISLGLNYLIIQPTNTCPLCQSIHPSSDKLKKIVEENSLVSDFIRENSHELEKIISLKNHLKLRLDSILKEILYKKSNDIADLQLELKSLSLQITKLTNEVAKINLQINSKQKYVRDCQIKVRNLEEQDLKNSLYIELEQLTNSYNKKLEVLKNEGLIIEREKMEVAAINSNLQKSLLRINNIMSKECYGKVQIFLEDNRVTLPELQTLCANKIIDIEVKNAQMIQLLNKIDKERSTLKAEMIKDGNWIDSIVINEKKTAISSKLIKQELLINSFFDAIDKYLDKENPRVISSVERLISEKINKIFQKIEYIEQKVDKFELLSEQLAAFKPYIKSLEFQESLKSVDKKIFEHRRVKTLLSDELEFIFESLKERIGEFFYTDLINSIYSKIDPHPSFKKVRFIPNFEESERPKLDIVSEDDSGDVISPSLYFSAAQLNILSLSVFLAKALHVKDDKGVPLDVILIDDPVQSMDSINVLAMIDLLRNISVNFDKQIIISTHDENFFNLLKRKIPSEFLGSKFLTLESFGVVGAAL